MTITLTIDTSNMSQPVINNYIKEIKKGIPFFGSQMFHCEEETLPIGRTTHAEINDQGNIIAHIKIPNGLQLGGKYPYSIEELLQAELSEGTLQYKGQFKNGS